MFKGKGRGRGRDRLPFNKAAIECFKCHRLGHFQYGCPTWEKGVNYAETVEGEELLLIAYEEFNHEERKEI